MALDTSLLTIRMLGTPLVERRQQPWSLASQKAQALLFFLATNRQAQSRDYLTALLWGDTVLNNARHSLRSSLYKLRQALHALEADAALLAEGEQLALNWQLVQSDVVQFYELLASDCEHDLRTAVGLIRGSFLQGFSLPDATLFDEFVHQQEVQIVHSHQQALQRLARFAEDRQDWAQAIQDLQALTRIDPLDEQAHQRLMALYVRSGSPGLAQRHYQLVERTFEQELGLAPAEETRMVVRTALAQQRTFDLAPAPRVSFLRSQNVALPFVGRHAMLNQLHEISQQVAAGVGRAVLIEADAGMGKSRLVEELIALLQKELHQEFPWCILQGRCSPFDSILAYGPFREAFAAFPALNPGELSVATLPSGALTERFADLVLPLLTMLSQQGPLLLAIDDLHAADQSSLQLFGYLALHVRHLPILLVGTVQHIDDTPALQQLVAVGRRHGDVAYLRLTPLTTAAIDTLLADLGLSERSRSSLAPWLMARAAGNPFVIEALLNQLRVERLLVPKATGWSLDNTRWVLWQATTPLPETTFDLVRLRLSTLQPLARQVVDLLAIAGDRLPLQLITNTIGPDPAALYEAIALLLELRLAFENDDNVVLAHTLLREAALHQLNRLKQKALHQQLALAWETFSSPHAPANLQIARHAVAGGDRDRARRYGLALLNDLPHAYAGAETVAFLQQLTDLVSPDASLDDQRRLAHALGQAYRSLGQVEQAESYHQRQLALAREGGSPEMEVVAYFELAELAFIRTDYGAAIAAAQHGLQRSIAIAEPQQLALQGRGHRLVGGAQAMEGSDLPAADSHLRAAIAAHRQANDVVNLSSALFELGNVLAQQGAIEKAVEQYAAAGTVLEPGQAPFLRALAANNLSYHSLLLGRPDAARSALAQGRALAEQHGLITALLHLFSTESELHLYSGQWDEAETCSSAGLVIAERLGNLERQAGYRASLARVAMGRGELAAAHEQLEAALTMIKNHTFWHLRTRLLLWLAELALAQKQEAARAYLETAHTLARTQQRQLLLLQAERLQALQLAYRDPAKAQAWLVQQLEHVTMLDMGLEIARTRAALARLMLQHTPRSTSGRALLDTALRELTTYGAHAEAAALRASVAA
jgi:DNA-binding SARP family transcriptional activator